MVEIVFQMQKYFHLYFKGLEGHGPLQIVGSFVVLSSIVGMTFSDWLESKNLCKSKAKVQEDVEDVEKNENSESLLKNNET